MGKEKGKTNKDQNAKMKAIEKDEERRSSLTKIMLEASVTMFAMQFKQQPIDLLWTELETQRYQMIDMLVCSEEVTGFVLGSKTEGAKGIKKGKMAKGFNKFAKLIAILSVVVEGGIDIFGLHFEFPHPRLSDPEDAPWRSRPDALMSMHPELYQEYRKILIDESLTYEEKTKKHSELFEKMCEAKVPPRYLW